MVEENVLLDLNNPLPPLVRGTENGRTLARITISPYD
jgi:hypothetical protein